MVAVAKARTLRIAPPSRSGGVVYAVEEKFCIVCHQAQSAFWLPPPVATLCRGRLTRAAWAGTQQRTLVRHACVASRRRWRWRWRWRRRACWRRCRRAASRRLPIATRQWLARRRRRFCIKYGFQAPSAVLSCCDPLGRVRMALESGGAPHKIGSTPHGPANGAHHRC